MAGPPRIPEHNKTFRLVMYKSMSGWRWYLKTKNHRTVAASTESYKHRGDAVSNLYDAAGIPVAPRGRESRYRWVVYRSLGRTTASALP